MGLVTLVILLILIGGALVIVSRSGLDAGMMQIIRVGAMVVALIALFLFAIRVLETGTIPLR